MESGCAGREVGAGRLGDRNVLQARGCGFESLEEHREGAHALRGDPSEIRAARHVEIREGKRGKRICLFTLCMLANGIAAARISLLRSVSPSRAICSHFPRSRAPPTMDATKQKATQTSWQLPTPPPNAPVLKVYNSLTRTKVGLVSRSESLGMTHFPLVSAD